MQGYYKLYEDIENDLKVKWKQYDMLRNYEYEETGAEFIKEYV